MGIWSLRLLAVQFRSQLHPMAPMAEFLPNKRRFDSAESQPVRSPPRPLIIRFDQNVLETIVSYVSAEELIGAFRTALFAGFESSGRHLAGFASARLRHGQRGSSERRRSRQGSYC